MWLPEKIAIHLPKDEYLTDNVGRSGATVLEYPDQVLKVQEDCNVSANELFMLEWMQGRVPVPEIIASAHENGLRYLLMTRMPGRFLCDEAILDDQERLAALCAEGLKCLWQADISSCPTRRTLDEKFSEIEEGLRSGRITRENRPQPELYEGPQGFTSTEALFDWLLKHRPQEQLVLSHGDFCMPNVFADERGLTGFIDVGLAGVADKWVDVEKCLWSMWANTTGVFGGKQRPFDRRLLFEALDMEPDEERLHYYSLLDDLC